MERILNEFVARAKKTYGDRLVSVILYGSAAVGDHHGRFSDINVLCVLNEVTAGELRDSVDLFRWWQGHGNPPPLLFGLDEFRNSSDCFPMEYRDIRDRRRVLYGEDVMADVEVDTSFYRAQVEHELRAKLLRLREKAGAAMGASDLLVGLMADSLSTFCVLFRHALLLHGEEAAFEKRAVVQQAAARFGVDPAPFERLLELREGKIKARQVEAEPVFEHYLKQIQVVVDAVDRLEK